jgi:hypothetical protein
MEKIIICIAAVLIMSSGAYAQDKKIPETGNKAEKTSAKKKKTLIDPENITFGCPYYSAKLKQVACINGFSEEGEEIFFNLNVLDEIGDGVRSVVFNEKNLGEKKPTTANIEKIEKFLVENGFSMVKEELFGAGGVKGQLQIKKLGITVRGEAEELIFVGKDKYKVFKFHLPVMKPHEPKIITMSVMPGTRSVVLTFFNDPGSMYSKEYNRNWTSHVIQIPRNIQ